MSEVAAETPSLGEDALSHVLGTIKLHGGRIFRSTAAAGTSTAQPDAPLLHIIEYGRCTLSDGQALEQGDLVLLPRGFGHSIHADSDTGWVTGTISYEPSAMAHRLLAVLPEVNLVRLGPDDPREWFDVSVRLMLQEVTDPLPGGSVMVSRIIDLLVIQALRFQAQQGSLEASWLKGAMDPHIGRAVTALHREPGAAWTVATLAATARLSRSVFSDRFTSLTGVPPMTYLTARRMELAAELLTTTSLAVRAIGARCGYGSEAAFSRAFRRCNGTSPHAWRQGDHR